MNEPTLNTLTHRLDRLERERARRDVSLKLAQQGSAVTGTISMEHSVRFGAGEKPIEKGQVSGRTFSFEAQGEASRLRPTLTIEDDRIRENSQLGVGP